jgi:hypothetical protein
MARLKVVFVGSVGSGKTTAIRAISETPSVETEVRPAGDFGQANTITTVAMDFGYLTLEDNTRLYLFGTSGLRRFDSMSQLLAENALGLVILVNSQDDGSLEELNYYLDLYGEILKEKAAVIGVTHYDMRAKHSLGDYQDVLRKRGELWPILKLDARKTEHVLLLLEALIATLKYG